MLQMLSAPINSRGLSVYNQFDNLINKTSPSGSVQDLTVERERKDREREREVMGSKDTQRRQANNFTTPMMTMITMMM